MGAIAKWILAINIEQKKSIKQLKMVFFFGNQYRYWFSISSLHLPIKQFLQTFFFKHKNNHICLQWAIEWILENLKH